MNFSDLDTSTKDFLVLGGDSLAGILMYGLNLNSEMIGKSKAAELLRLERIFRLLPVFLDSFLLLHMYGAIFNRSLGDRCPSAARC